jgi:hypothetical protein
MSLFHSLIRKIISAILLVSVCHYSLIDFFNNVENDSEGLLN